MSDLEHDADIAACRLLVRTQSPGLYFGSLSLPPRIRRPAMALYGFSTSIAQALRERTPLAAADTRARVAAIVGTGAPPALAVDRAMARVVREFAIPRAPLDALVEGFSWDADGRRFATIDGLVDYCVRVAGAPGLVLTLIMGRRRRSVLERSCDLSIAVQLTRIVRDVGQDARNGRVYLPLEWLEEAGVDVDAFLEAPHPTAAVTGVIRRVRKSADAFFSRADPGIFALPFDCRPAVRASRYIYSGILSEIEKRGYDSITERVELSLPRKLRLIARALRASRSETRPLEEQSHPGFAALVRACSIG